MVLVGIQYEDYVKKIIYMKPLNTENERWRGAVDSNFSSIYFVIIAFFSTVHYLKKICSSVLQVNCVSLIVQMVKNFPAIQRPKLAIALN